MSEADPLMTDDPLDCALEGNATVDEGWIRFEAAAAAAAADAVGLGARHGTRTEDWREGSEGGKDAGTAWDSDAEKGRRRRRRTTTTTRRNGGALAGREPATDFSAVADATGNLAVESDAKRERGRKYYEQLKTERKYQCDICRKTFITNGHLSTHMHRHSGKKWTCDGCGRNFSCVRSLVRHRDTFPGEHWFPCKFCDMTFFRAANIAKHVEIKHPEEVVAGNAGEASLPTHADRRGDYKCEVCAKEFVSAEGFDYHRTHRHADKESKRRRRGAARGGEEEEEEGDGDGDGEGHSIRTFGCRICSSSFATKSALQTHLKSHNVTKNVEVRSGSHRCCICPRSFTSSDSLKYHLATHTGERRYACGECGKRFIKKTHLSEHVATHSAVKYFKCPRCPRTFSTHSTYRKHVKQFPGPHSFPCKKCGKLFTRESMIEKHMCVDLVKITMAPEVKALLSEDMIEEYLCLAEEQMAAEMSGDRGVPCYKCFKVFPNLAALQAHQNDHVGKQNYQCRFCPESFRRADAFGAHIRNHLGSTPYMCMKCNRKFISPFTLSMHARNYPGDHSFTCHKCRRWFPSEKRLENHECILHSCDRFACACGSTFASWNELLAHAGAKPYKCCACELTYPTLTALARHIKKHTGVKPFSCEVCGKAFRARNNYLSHKNVHRDAKEIRCEHCEYKSKSQKRMDFHLFRKHEIGSNVAKSTLCPFCGVIFPYISHMKKHVEAEHGNGLALEDAPGERKALPAELCTLCGKLLNNKYTLANHMKKVHDPNSADKKDRMMKCEFCEERFHTAKKLQRHAEVHEAPGPRTCQVCQMEFYFAKELRKHMRKHDTNKPFSCPKCGKHFKVAASLKYHSTICGNVSQRGGGGGGGGGHALRGKEDAKEGEGAVATSADVLYGHIDPIDLNSQQCMLQMYGR